jgi:hypothetical protein
MLRTAKLSTRSWNSVAQPHAGPLPAYGHHIDGKSAAPASGEHMLTEDPFTGRAWARIARGNRDDVAAAVNAAGRAFREGPWPALTASERGRLLWRLADAVTANGERLAEVERRDNGKLATEVTAQVRYTGDYFKYYAGLADKIQSAVIPTDKKGVFAYTKYEPKGVVAIITPWNSPLTLTSWKLAPALAAGCTTVVKPSEYTSASMLEFARIATEAGLPNGVLNVVTGLGPEVGEALVTHPDVAHVGFTGGDAAGRRIYELAARGLKTVTLELGGKSPNIVFDDADLAQGRERRRFRHLRRVGTELPGGIAAARAAVDPRPVRRHAGGFHARGEARRSGAAGHANGTDRHPAPVREDRELHRARQARRRHVRAGRRACARISALDGSSSRRSSPACATTCASRRKRSSVRCSR